MQLKFENDKIHLKSCIPILKPGKVYRIDISYKDELNMYSKLNVHPIFALVLGNEKVSFYYYISELIPTKYVNHIEDYTIYGPSKKKISIRKSRKSFYQLEVMTQDASMNHQILLFSHKPVDWKKELEKKFSNYIYEIKDYTLRQEDNIYFIQIKIDILSKKTLSFQIASMVSAIHQWRKKYHPLN